LSKPHPNPRPAPELVPLLIAVDTSLAARAAGSADVDPVATGDRFRYAGADPRGNAAGQRELALLHPPS